MAILFLDGFDHYATADGAQKYSSFSCTIGSGNGRNSTNAAAGSDHADTRALTRTLSPGNDTVIIGFAHNFTSSFPSASARFIRIKDSGGAVQFTFSWSTSGTILAHRGDFVTLLGTSSAGVSIGSFFYVEFKVAIHDSTGTVHVRINGTEVLALTGQDTKATATAGWASVEIGAFADAFNGPFAIDDLYIADGSGSANNDFLGPIRVKTIFPDGAGNSTDFTPSAGLNYQNVDEASTDGDTTYNSEGTAGDHDTYTFGAVGVTGTVRGIQTNLMVRSDGAGSETIRPKIRIGLTDYSGTTVGITTSYTDSREVFQVSPATSTTWTVTEIDGAEFGIELVS